MRKFLSWLVNTFGEDWYLLEPETILLDLPELNEVLLDQFNVLRLCVSQPELLWHDPVFFLYAVAPFNNESTNFEVFPNPTSLEVASVLVKAVDMFGMPESVGEGVQMVIERSLKEDGYSEVPSPFKAFVPNLELAQGQELQDMANKREAISKYLESTWNS